MNTYQFRKEATEAQRDTLTLALRKDGYRASRETDTLSTDASLTAINLVTVGPGIIDLDPLIAAAKAEAAERNLYLIEFYTRHERTGQGGWEINFAWVYAPDKAAAKAKLAANQGRRFDEVITCEEQAEITPLAGKFTLNGNLFIIN